MTTPAITARAHTDCVACDASADAALAYARAGGSAGTFRSSTSDGGPHWATIATARAQWPRPTDSTNREHDQVE